MSHSRFGSWSPASSQHDESGRESPTFWSGGPRQDDIELSFVISEPDYGHHWQWGVTIHSRSRNEWQTIQMASEPGLPATPLKRPYGDPRTWSSFREMRPFADLHGFEFSSLYMAIINDSLSLTHRSTRPQSGGSGIDVDAGSRSHDFASRLAQKLAHRGLGSMADVHAAEGSLGQYIGRQPQDLGRPQGRSLY